MFQILDRPRCMILILQKVLNVSFEVSTEFFVMWLEMERSRFDKTFNIKDSLYAYRGGVEESTLYYL